MTWRSQFYALAELSLLWATLAILSWPGWWAFVAWAMSALHALRFGIHAYEGPPK